jgi:diguanylate cyclase (GGDEF)-like protein/PAS domain S-box-containing protein
MPDSLDSRVLGQLLLLQGTLDSMPADESISRFVFRGLKNIPGVGFLNVCIRGAAAGQKEMCADCQGRWDKPMDISGLPCIPKNDDGVKYIPVRTVDSLYGLILYSLHDPPGAFTPYQPYLQNIANVVALSIDNRWQKQILNASNIQLQREAEHRERTAAAMRESENRYHSLFENMLDGFAYCKMLYDEGDRPVDFVYLEVNAAFKKLTGMEDVLGKKATEVFPEIRALNPELLEIYGRVASAGGTETFEVAFKPLAKTLSISVYSPQKGYFVAVFDDITERKRLGEKLEYYAAHDVLTGLLNRRALEEMLNRSVARAKRGVASSLLYLDLDNFKEVNDTVGHGAGDEVLITLSNLLKAELRTEDVIFRVGGDEFAVLLEGTNRHASHPVAERLRAAVEAHPFEFEGRAFRLSLSIGLIEIDGALATGMLLAQADAAMYRAKEQGKNRIVQARKDATEE